MEKPNTKVSIHKMWQKYKPTYAGARKSICLRKARKSLQRRWHLSQGLKDEQGFLWRSGWGELATWGICCCSVTKSYSTLCDPMDCSTPGFPVLNYLPEFAQTHHSFSDAIQPSHPLSPSSSAFSLPHQTTILPSCISFFLGWFWSPPFVQCYEPLPIVLQALYQI